MTQIPTTQHAVQLIGPGELRLNEDKEVFTPGPYQILARVEAVGLCFSDLKLLKQFTGHARKSEIMKGLTAAVLNEIPSYVPGGKPTVPGHEVSCRIVAVGDKVLQHKVGERCLVQTDYRALPTAESNSAFGYNFEGGLQEYVLMDERVVVEPGTGERYLIPVGEGLSASAVALIEPWACVEDSYVSKERQGVKAGGRMLVVVDESVHAGSLEPVVTKGSPAHVTLFGDVEAVNGKLHDLGVVAETVLDLESLADTSFDDILYYGSKKETIEILNGKLGTRGIFNLVLCGGRIGASVSIGVGRVHYGMTRWIGTTGSDAAESYATIPATGEVRPCEQIVVIGAGGPMGQMHVIRDICCGQPGLTLYATDMDDERLESLKQKAEPLAKLNNVDLQLINTKTTRLTDPCTYVALMAPVAPLVAEAVRDCADNCIINIFAGIPAPVKQEIDLDAYVSKRCFMFGTSGSVIEDMKIVLRKVESGQLDTNCSVDAVSGMAGAIEGIAAVENRTLAGKIIIYPMLHDMGLIPLSQLEALYPAVAAKLSNGQWCKAAEEQLLKMA